MITFQSDITTKECSETIGNNLSNWKADIVLHDGAPNVGKNWLHDAYGQNVLVVNALKIACTHLNKGGWFITKIFRSSDYNSLLWVFGKLFVKVHATKPQASRQESAEIFVVCQSYKKPSDIDPKFFDPSALFADISDFDVALKKQKSDLLKPANKVKKAKAIGYENDDALRLVSDIDFVTSNNHMDHLAQCHEIKLTNPDISKHEATSEEIKECCKDLKVLGRKELLKLLKWRRTLRKDLTAKLLQASKKGTFSVDNEVDGIDGDNLDHLTINSDDEDIEAIPKLQLDDLESQQEEEKRKELRRVKKKDEKRNKDYEQRVKYGMVNQGDVLIEEEHDLFKLVTIGGKNELDDLDDVEPDELVDDIVDPEDSSNANRLQKKSVTFSREADTHYFEQDSDYDQGDDEDTQLEIEEGPEKLAEPKIEVPKNNLKTRNTKGILNRLEPNANAGGGLLTDLLDVNQWKIAAASKFYDRDTFGDIDLEKEFEIDLVNKIASSKMHAKLDDAEEEVRKQESNKRKPDDMARFDDKSSSEDECSDSDEGKSPNKKKQIKLDPQGLALASMMISSKKMRKDIEDEGWNRYTHGDSHLAPKWFREEEAKHCRRNIPVRQELVKEYKQKLREIDAKPIKKVMQAKARQKRRALRKMEKVKKKVDAITSNDDITQRERINAVKTVYRNATKSKKKEVKLVVGRKGLPAKKPTKGKYKMVDARLKKDLKAKERRDNKGKKVRKSTQRSKKRRPMNNSFSSKGPSKKMKSKKGSKSKKR